MSEPMREQHPCIRCARSIDDWAKICPFCNWDQSVAPPAREPPKPQAVIDYRPPPEYDIKKKVMLAGAGALTLAAAFAVGMVINSGGAPKVAPPKTVEEQLAEEQQARSTSSWKRADTPLVLLEGPDGLEQPITSAPVTSEPGIAANDYQRSDATAVSASEYAEMAKRAKAEKKRIAMAVDPRSLTGAAYSQAPLPRRVMPQPPPSQEGTPEGGSPQPQGSMATRTRPVPQFQPLPHISSAGTARLSLMIGADGRVQQIDIERPLQHNTAQLVSAVQSWRFKPATLNGDPIAAPYSVEISFKQ